MSFNKKDFRWFAIGAMLILAGFFCMGYDPVDNGFGMLTLWVAPLLLMAGFLLPIKGILGSDVQLSPARWLRGAEGLTGMGVLLVSLITYTCTLEPTSSLWDCPEFIASAYKLQVSHTPGTPLSLLIGRLFSMLAPTKTTVAWMINLMSAVMSAFSVLFVYRIILILSRRMGETKEFLRSSAAASGSLVLTFTDTFWFSAVEAETYGPACFMMMVIILLTLTGTDLDDQRRPRRMFLIFYLAGLGYCIHPMCVLALPVLPFTWILKDRKLTFRNTVLTCLGGLGMVLLINKVIAVGTFELAFSFDRYFVNVLGFPFYSGAIAFLILVAVGIYYLITRLPKTKHVTLAIVFLAAGFAPYGIVFIRSSKNPPIDENNPENLALIKAYMNRESYPNSPLLYGPYFDAEILRVTASSNIYHKTKDRYEFSGTMTDYDYDPSRSTLFPRMFSNDPAHIQAYRDWTGLKENQKPGMRENLYFMFTYQVWHMYFRYLMFNFAGRQSDHQNDGWLTPLDSLNAMNGPSFANKARNQYWMIPLALGMAGLVMQYRKDQRGFIVVLMLFLITGVVLVLYLNPGPTEPRERDYIYVGSFIAFCMWIGIGISQLASRITNTKVQYAVALMLAAAVPLQMLIENLDDHNRSGRTFQMDSARNLLTGCAPNAILFTGGDNDTFPLWYLQDVEGIRTDIRVVVLSYLNTDWYINQLRKQYYGSQPFQLTLTPQDYLQYGPNDVLYLQESIREGIDMKKFMAVLQLKDSPLRAQSQTGDLYSILPSRKLKLNLTAQRNDTSRQGIHLKVSGNEPHDGIRKSFEINVKGNYLQKNALAIIDLIASNNFTRPVYFNFTSLNTAGLDVEKHVVQEGNLYRLDPEVVAPLFDEIPVDEDISYANLITKANYDNLADPDVYFNHEDFELRVINPVRQSFNSLAINYVNSDNPEKATEVMEFAMKHLYFDHLMPSFANLQAADLLSTLDKPDDARRLSEQLFNFYYQKIIAYRHGNKSHESGDVYLARAAAEILARLGDSSFKDRMTLFMQ